MSDTTNKNDLQAWYNGLSDTDKATVDAQDKMARYIAEKNKKPVNVATMSDAEFAAYRRSLGIG
jgi:hypothetical protein